MCRDLAECGALLSVGPLPLVAGIEHGTFAFLEQSETTHLKQRVFFPSALNMCCSLQKSGRSLQIFDGFLLTGQSVRL